MQPQSKFFGRPENRTDPASQGRPGLRASLKGTESSNTVPYNSNSSCLTKVLRTGVDSLYLSFKGSLSESMSARLTKLKGLAQSSRDSEVSLAQVRLQGQLFSTQGNGSHPYSFVLVGDHHRISVAKLGAKLLPLAYARISSEQLTALGPTICIFDLEEIIQELGDREGSPNVSRVDLCADFITDYPLESVSEREFVTKARSFSRHTVARRFSGFSFGAGSPFSARLYNKTLEIKSKKRPRSDLEELWFASGWDGNQEVWRLEFQLRREALRGFDITSDAELLDNLSSLWAYATSQWLRRTEPSETDLTSSRWLTTRWWETLQSAFWGDFGTQPLTRSHVESGHAPSDEFLFINGLSTLTSYSAKFNVLSPEEAARDYIRDAREFHDDR